VLNGGQRPPGRALKKGATVLLDQVYLCACFYFIILARTLRVRRARGNKLGADGWTAVADALEGVMSLTSLNGCDKCRAIRAGGQTQLLLEKEWELGVWAARYLPRSASTLTTLDLRHAG
jgi:hypothetical protein